MRPGRERDRGVRVQALDPAAGLDSPDARRKRCPAVAPRGAVVESGPQPFDPFLGSLCVGAQVVLGRECPAELADAALALERRDGTHKGRATQPVRRRKRCPVPVVGPLGDHGRGARGAASRDSGERTGLAPEQRADRVQIAGVDRHARKSGRSAAHNREWPNVPPSKRPSQHAVRRRRGRALVIAIAAVLTLYGYAGPVQGWLDARDRVARTRADVRELRSEALELDRRLQAAREQPALEALARADGWIYPGETPYLAR